MTLHEILTVEHIQDLLGFESARRARAWLARSGMPYIRVGRRNLVLRKTLLEFLEARQEGRE
jgi:Helix-turn-helix domain